MDNNEKHLKWTPNCRVMLACLSAHPPLCQKLFLEGKSRRLLPFEIRAPAVKEDKLN